jgi:hypothetical protein
MSVRAASEAFSVPRSTIGDRLTGKHDLNTKHGRPPAIPMYIEETIVKTIKKASKLGVGLSQKQIMSRTNFLCQHMKVGGSYKNFKAGKRWFDGLMRRFPDVVLRKQEKLNSERMRMLNPGVVDNYFKFLGKLITDLGLQDHPEQIWNWDEMGFNFKHAPGKVVAEKGDHCVLS